MTDPVLEKTKLPEPGSDPNAMYCPRCGATNLVRFPVGKCRACSWKVVWTGPLWGSRDS